MSNIIIPPNSIGQPGSNAAIDAMCTAMIGCIQQLQAGILTSTALLQPITSSTMSSNGGVPTVGTTSVQLLPVNTSRKGFFLYNDGSTNALITFGPTSNEYVFTMNLPAAGFYSMTQAVIWAGAVSAVRSSGSGAITVFEMI